MGEETRINIEPRKKRIIDIPKGFRYKIIAAGITHRNRVEEKRLGETTSGDTRYEIKNPNDSPLLIIISKIDKEINL